MDEKLEVKELVLYYVNRYGLPTDGRSSSTEYADDGIGPYYAKIKRILQNTRIAEMAVWDVINPEKGPRKLSVSFFEKHCFAVWEAYIRKNCKGHYNQELLESDSLRYKTFLDNEYWEQQAVLTIAAHNAALENEDYGTDNGNISFITPEEVVSKGHEMMLEAIYSIFYKPFKWQALQKDMENAEIADEGYNPNITADTMIARARLTDFTNYTGTPIQKP